MSRTIDELSPKFILSTEVSHATPARRDHSGGGALCATVFAPSLAPCPALAARRDSGSWSPHGDGRLASHGDGPGTSLHELPSCLESSNLVRPAREPDSVGYPPHATGTARGDGRAWRG